MIKTTQKIYFPKAFKMPGQHAFKKSLPRKEPDSVKKAVVNLETNSDLSPSIMSHSFLGKELQQTFCEHYQDAKQEMLAREHSSFLSIGEQELEAQTNKSGKSTRRSRKDRSGTGRGRNAVTPHLLCSLNGQNSLRDANAA